MATLSGMATAARAQAVARRLVVACSPPLRDFVQKKGVARRSLRKEARPLKWTPVQESRRPQPMVTGMLHRSPFAACPRSPPSPAATGHRSFVARHRRESLVVMVVRSSRRSRSLAAISASRSLADEGARTVSSSHHCSSRLPGAHCSQVADARPEPLLAEGSRWPRGALARLGWVAAIVSRVDPQLAAQVELFAQGFEQPAAAAKRRGAARCSFLQGGETAQVDAGSRGAAVRSYGDRHAPLLAIRCLSKVTAARWPPPDTAVRRSPSEGVARRHGGLLAEEGAAR
ncbi:hypothetical protein Dimus_031412 [Dionaea muscipula]